MMTFALLTRLSPDASHAPPGLQALERDVVDRVEKECPSLRWVANYVALGNCNYLDLFEAPDIETALKVGLTVGAHGTAQTEVWPLVAWAQFKDLLNRESPEAAGASNDAPAPAAPPADRVSAALAYLRNAGVPFQLASFPMLETEPAIAHALRPGAKEVITHVVLANRSPALVGLPKGASLDLAGLGRAIGVAVVEATSGDLPGPFRGVREPVPPLGHLVGVPLFVDERLDSCTTVAFQVSPGAYVEMAYDDFARIEQPRLISLAKGSEPNGPAPTPATAVS